MLKKRLTRKANMREYNFYVMIPLDNEYRKNSIEYFDSLSGEDIKGIIEKYKEQYEGKPYIAIHDIDTNTYLTSNGETINSELLRNIPPNGQYKFLNESYKGNGNEFEDFLNGESKNLIAVWCDLSYEQIKEVAGNHIDEMIKELEKMIG